MVILSKCTQFLSWVAKSCAKGIRTKRIHQLLKLLIILQCGVSLTSCTNKLGWQEDVKLLDGRVILVYQERQFEGKSYNGSTFGSMPREFWITINLPEISKQEIVWHEKLLPTNLNIFKGRLYIVGIPNTQREFELYNKPRPPYVGYLFENNQWKRIPFNEIPQAIYDMNLAFSNEGFSHNERVTLVDKAREDKIGVPKSLIRIDPLDRFPND